MLRRKTASPPEPVRKPRSRDEHALARKRPADVAVLREFSRRLQLKMAEHGWNGSELARQAAKHTANGKFGRDQVSKYIRGLARPYSHRLHALCQALRCEPEDLMPREAYQTAAEAVSPEIDLRSAPEPGPAWLRVHMKVPFETAAEVLALLKRVQRG